MDKVIDAEITALADNSTEERSLQALRSAIEGTASRDLPAHLQSIAPLDFTASIFPGSGFRDWITRRVTRSAIPDAYDYFFVKPRREAMRESLRERMETGGPFIVIAHSQGSMIAYDVLSGLSPRVKVPLFITLGSPLDITEVQDQIRRITGKPLRVPSCVGNWLNVADPFDPVAADKGLRNDFGGQSTLRDVLEFNPDGPRHPHSGTGYLSMDVVRSAVRSAADTAQFQRVAPFTIARDLATEIEAGSSERRHQVLIEFSLPKKQVFSDLKLTDIRNQQSRLESELESITARLTGGDLTPLRIDHLRHFTCAHLTRRELEHLADADLQEISIRYFWRNAEKRALLDQSVHTVQAHSARRGYGADGNGIVWAVLDSGINKNHPHFSDQTVLADFDTTAHGPITDDGPDLHGHGTHVSGIIAGQLPSDSASGNIGLTGIAPACRLVSYRVLDHAGRGSDASIIKALDHIAETNERASQLVIHGVNLSLGGPFDPSVYGCGHTPLCRELERLWEQGVAVVIAAGNEGYAVLASARGDIQANLDLTISDPANLDLEAAISVGSVNKHNPHSYGVSYFSSRGPTADGRIKPDLVAPGEDILSCRHDFVEGNIDNLYVTMSGTSMAAPHVSGILAAFLSVRREFIGQPDHIKKLLLQNCTDLGRETMRQGCGLPNLTKMLLHT